MKIIARSLRATFSAFLFAAGLNVATARCNIGHVETPTLDELLTAKQQFDNKTVCIDGTASGVKETTSCAGNDYTTIVVTEPQSNRMITVFTWGHPGIVANARIQCTGKFEIRKVVQSRCDGKVRRIPFNDQISGTCQAQ